MSFGELQTCVREAIPVTAVVFNNGQWGAEKKNHVDFYDNRFVGVNLDKQPSWAAVAKAMGAEGVRDRQARPTSVRRCATAATAQTRRQDDGPRDDGDARAGRPVPARRAVAAGAPSRQVPVDGSEAQLTASRARIRRGARMSELREARLEVAAGELTRASVVGEVVDSARAAQQ